MKKLVWTIISPGLKYCIIYMTFLVKKHITFTEIKFSRSSTTTDKLKHVLLQLTIILAAKSPPTILSRYNFEGNRQKIVKAVEKLHESIKIRTSRIDIIPHWGSRSQATLQYCRWIRLDKDTAYKLRLSRTTLELPPILYIPRHIMATRAEDVCNIQVANTGPIDSSVGETGDTRSIAEKLWTLEIKIRFRKKAKRTISERQVQTKMLRL